MVFCFFFLASNSFVQSFLRQSCISSFLLKLSLLLVAYFLFIQSRGLSASADKESSGFEFRAQGLEFRAFSAQA